MLLCQGQQKVPAFTKMASAVGFSATCIWRRNCVQYCSLTFWLDTESDRGHQYISMGVDSHVVTLCHLLPVMFLCWFTFAGQLI